MAELFVTAVLNGLTKGLAQGLELRKERQAQAEANTIKAEESAAREQDRILRRQEIKQQNDFRNDIALSNLELRQQAEDRQAASALTRRRTTGVKAAGAQRDRAKDDLDRNNKTIVKFQQDLSEIINPRIAQLERRLDRGTKMSAPRRKGTELELDGQRRLRNNALDAISDAEEQSRGNRKTLGIEPRDPNAGLSQRDQFAELFVGAETIEAVRQISEGKVGTLTGQQREDFIDAAARREAEILTPGQ